MASQSEILERMRRAGVKLITNDHFVYVSGKHGRTYIKFDQALTRPTHQDMILLCQLMALKFLRSGVEVVIGPERGAVILAELVAEELSKMMGREIRSFPALKIDDGEFDITDPEAPAVIMGRKVLVVEDTINKGTNTRKVVRLVRGYDGNVIGVAALWNRGGVSEGDIYDVPRLYSLVNQLFDSVDENVCSACKRKWPPVNTEYGHGREFLERQQLTLQAEASR